MLSFVFCFRKQYNYKGFYICYNQQLLSSLVSSIFSLFLLHISSPLSSFLFLFLLSAVLVSSLLSSPYFFSPLPVSSPFLVPLSLLILDLAPLLVYSLCSPCFLRLFLLLFILSSPYRCTSISHCLFSPLLISSLLISSLLSSPFPFISSFPHLSFF